jgi:NTE family protein
MTSITDRAPVLVDFALQGGGAHGAFTWGVLDRLLEEPWYISDRHTLST